MIKINLIAERKAPKAGKAATGVSVEGTQAQNLLLVAILLLGVIVSGVWWWSKNRELDRLNVKIEEASIELERLEEIRKKGEYYKAKKALLERQIQLVTDLKKAQTVPVHILDQVSKSLPDFLWLNQMSAQSNQITLRGKATTYNAVSNFYNNLATSGHFTNVVLGRTSESAEGVDFSLNCTFSTPGEPAASDDVQG